MLGPVHAGAHVASQVASYDAPQISGDEAPHAAAINKNVKSWNATTKSVFRPADMFISCRGIAGAAADKVLQIDFILTIGSTGFSLILRKIVPVATHAPRSPN